MKLLIIACIASAAFANQQQQKLDDWEYNGIWKLDPDGLRENYRWDTMRTMREFTAETARQCLARQKTLVIGDSTARFFFAALADLMAIELEKPAPLHYLPANDTCSMPKVGWVGGCPKKTCCKRWRGEFISSTSSVLHSDLASFMWMGATREATPERLSLGCNNETGVLMFGAGLWDLLLRRKSVAVTSQRINNTLTLLEKACPSAHTKIFLGPSSCPNTTDPWPGSAAVKMVDSLAAELENIVADKGWLYLNRLESQASAPTMATSLCHHHHAHGILSDTHVQIVLNMLC